MRFKSLNTDHFNKEKIMFHILLLIFHFFRDGKPNLSGSLWGLLDRRKAVSSVPQPPNKAKADLKALDPIQGN